MKIYSEGGPKYIIGAPSLGVASWDSIKHGKKVYFYSSGTGRETETMGNMMLASKYPDINTAILILNSIKNENKSNPSAFRNNMLQFDLNSAAIYQLPEEIELVKIDVDQYMKNRIIGKLTDVEIEFVKANGLD